MKLEQMKKYGKKDFEIHKYDNIKERVVLKSKRKKIATVNDTNEGDFVKVTRNNIFTSENFEHLNLLKEVIKEFSKDEDFKESFLGIEAGKIKIKAEEILTLSINDIKRIFYAKPNKNKLDTEEETVKQIYNGKISIICKLNDKNKNMDDFMKLFFSPNALNVAALLLKVKNPEKYKYYYNERNNKIKKEFLSSNSIGKLCNLSSRGVFDILQTLSESNIINIGYGEGKIKIYKQATFSEFKSYSEENPLLVKLEEKESEKNNPPESLKEKISTGRFFEFRK